jgi:hypothetical protein
MIKADRQNPSSGHVLDTTMAAAGPQVLVQVADRLADTDVMRRQDRLAGGQVTEAVEDRDALGRPQDHIKAGHSIPAIGTAQQLPSRRVAALEHGLEAGHGCFALQPKGCWRRRRTTDLGTHRGQTDTARGRWPARGCSTPPAPPRAWRCRPPPRRFPPAFVGASNAPLVHCSPRKMVWDESRPEASVRQAITRSTRMWRFLGEKRSAIVGSRVWREQWTADRCRHGWRAQERWD